MTDIEKQAMALVNEVRMLEHRCKVTIGGVQNEFTFKALCRAIEQHEAFRQEVSDAVTGAPLNLLARDRLKRFIIAKPDPLVEAWLEAFPGNHIDDAREECAKISTALAARGLKIVEVGHDRD